MSPILRDEFHFDSLFFCLPCPLISLHKAYRYQSTNSHTTIHFIYLYFCSSISNELTFCFSFASPSLPNDVFVTSQHRTIPLKRWLSTIIILFWSKALAKHEEVSWFLSSWPWEWESVTRIGDFTPKFQNNFGYFANN